MTALPIPTLPPAPPANAKGALRLIVHADDFGLSERVNDGVLDAHLNGILTSASVMVSAPAFEHAVRLSKEHPSLDIGLHLTLIEERPLLDPALVPSLVDETGCFHKHITVFAKRYMQGLINLDEVRLELEAQVRKAIDAGLVLSHFDSHQHVHMLPGILRVAQDLAAKYSIPAMRMPREDIRPYMLKSPAGLARVAQLFVLNLFCRRGRRGFGTHTDHFAGFYFGGKLDTSALQMVVSALPRSGTCELMCHPGEDDPSSGRLHWGYAWESELTALKQEAIAEQLRARGVKLISYRDLTA